MKGRRKELEKQGMGQVEQVGSAGDGDEGARGEHQHPGLSSSTSLVVAFY